VTAFKGSSPAAVLHRRRPAWRTTIWYQAALLNVPAVDDVEAPTAQPAFDRDTNHDTTAVRSHPPFEYRSTVFSATALSQTIVLDLVRHWAHPGRDDGL